MDVVSECVKLAREQALIGLYDESEASYVEALRVVSESLEGINEPHKKEKWREVSLSTSFWLMPYSTEG